MDRVSIYRTTSWHRILFSFSLKPGAEGAGHPDTLRPDVTVGVGGTANCSPGNMWLANKPMWFMTFCHVRITCVIIIYFHISLVNGIVDREFLKSRAFAF